MKIIAFDRHPGTPVNRPLNLELIADSAVVLPGKPLFLPDFTDRWNAELYPAFRISRLGKGITPKFAPRYYDAFTLALRIIPAAVLEQLRAGNMPCGIAGAFDHNLALGQWTALPEENNAVNISCGPFRTSLSLADTGINETLSAFSDVATLKMGDIMIPCRMPLSFTPAVGTGITATIDANTVLSVRIR